MFNPENWPIGASMLSFGNRGPNGDHINDAPAEFWAETLRQVKALGIDAIDPTDAWIDLAALSDERLDEFSDVLDDTGVKVISLSMSRRSIAHETDGEAHLETAFKNVEIAKRLDVPVLNIGYFGPLTSAQEEAAWFWYAEGYKCDPSRRDLALERTRELGDRCKEAGVELSLEMYEDTYVGTADDAVSFITDLDHEAVGLNPDIANLQRLHQPVEHWEDAFMKVLPHTNFFHVKNYLRDYDPSTGAYFSAPVPMKYGIINYRTVFRKALELGYSGPIHCEHYGNDAIAVIAENIRYTREILTSLSV